MTPKGKGSFLSGPSFEIFIWLHLDAITQVPSFLEIRVEVEVEAGVEPASVRAVGTGEEWWKLLKAKLGITSFSRRPGNLSSGYGWARPAILADGIKGRSAECAKGTATTNQDTADGNRNEVNCSGDEFENLGKMEGQSEKDSTSSIVLVPPPPPLSLYLKDCIVTESTVWGPLTCSSPLTVHLLWQPGFPFSLNPFFLYPRHFFFPIFTFFFIFFLLTNKNHKIGILAKIKRIGN